MYKIRNYSSKDFSMVESWWKRSDCISPSKEMLPEESTFILEIDSTPALSISVYLTNCKEFAILENFIGNPEMFKVRKEASQVIVDYAIEYAKQQGYKKIICLAYIEKLKKRYQQLGMTKTVDGLSSFVKEII